MNMVQNCATCADEGIEYDRPDFDYRPHPLFCPYVQRKFDGWAGMESADSRHEFDQERFHRFVIAAYQHGCPARDSQIREALEAAGFGCEDAREYTIVFNHCMDVLGMYDSPVTGG